MDLGDEALGRGDFQGAATEYAAAAAGEPDNPEIRFWQALGLASIGRTDEALPILARAVTANPDLVELLRRLREVELADADVADHLLEELG
jgi:tetratricopeptide (TPR) repeat protein